MGTNSCASYLGAGAFGQEKKPIGNESKYLQDLVEYDSKRVEFHLPDRKHDGSSWLDGNFGRYSILSGYENNLGRKMPSY